MSKFMLHTQHSIYFMMPVNSLSHRCQQLQPLSSGKFMMNYIDNLLIILLPFIYLFNFFLMIIKLKWPSKIYSASSFLLLKFNLPNSAETISACALHVFLSCMPKDNGQ